MIYCTTMNKHKTRRIGTYCLSFLVASCLQANAQKVSFSEGSISLREAFQKIEAASNYKIAYNGTKLDVNKRVELNQKNTEVLEVLNQILAGTGYTYSVKGDYVVITPPSTSYDSVNQSVKTVTGTIVDEAGEPIIGANVLVEGTTNGTITDIDGKFTLNVPENATLDVSYIGFLTQKINVKGQSDLKITLREDTQKLDEVVVVGYGTRLRKSLTGAVDQVNDEVFENRPVTNATQALQGASANLIIQSKNANPNDNSMNINIRGVSTMGNNDPLIVIDGLISSTGTLNNLNPNDIENVSVLKDAGSAAIYGSRAANGVILITTKKGAAGKPKVTFNGQVGWQDPNILFHPVEGWQNAMLRNQANINAGSAPQFTPADIRDLYNHRDEEEWLYDQIMKTALQQNYNINVSGGSEHTTYMVSAGYYNQESNFEGSFGMERYNFRSNLTTEYGRFKLTTLMAYNRKKERTVAGGTGNVIINSSRVPSYYYYKFNEGDKWLVNDVVGDDNPMAYLKDGGYEKKDEDNFIGSMNLDFKIMDGLKATGLIGLDLTQHHRYRRDQKVPLYSSADLENPVLYIHSNTMTEDYNEKRYTLSTQFLLSYDKTFNEDHTVSALIGVSNESYTKQASRIAWTYTDEDLGLPTTDDSIQDTGNKNSNDDTDETSITSLFGRVGYNYKDKYYGDFSFRYDGSSKFNKDHRWGFFPSFSAGWRLSEESFMEDYKNNIGDLKLRVSYGVLGNQNVDNYSYQTVYTMNTNGYVFNNAIVPSTSYTDGNSLLTWEKASNFNVGVDATFLDGSLYVSADYFNKRTWDILLTPEVSSTYGGSTAKENAGEMKNQGWEVTINYRLNSGEFHHNFNLNISDSRNKVTDFGGEERIDNNDEMYKIIREGVALGSYYGYESDGLFQTYDEIANSALPVGASVQPGDVKYVDQNKDGVINEQDRVVIGNAFPRYTFGFTYNVAWRGIDLNIMLQGVGKRDMFLRGELMEPFHSNYSYCIYEHQLDFWTPTNPDARWPRLSAPGSASNTNNWSQPGDNHILNAAYLRVKNIQLGYTLPQAWTQKFGVSKLRVSLNAENPLTFCKNSFIDPESSEFGNNMGGIGGVGANSGRSYPTLSYYGFGLDIEF